MHERVENTFSNNYNNFSRIKNTTYSKSNISIPWQSIMGMLAFHEEWEKAST